MTAAARRAHLLALAYEAEREADHHFTEQEYDKGERFKKLAASYREMAEAAK